MIKKKASKKVTKQDVEAPVMFGHHTGIITDGPLEGCCISRKSKIRVVWKNKRWSDELIYVAKVTKNQVITSEGLRLNTKNFDAFVSLPVPKTEIIWPTSGLQLIVDYPDDLKALLGQGYLKSSPHATSELLYLACNCETPKSMESLLNFGVNPATAEGRHGESVLSVLRKKWPEKAKFIEAFLDKKKASKKRTRRSSSAGRR
jgi:hypothetical protein